MMEDAINTERLKADALPLEALFRPSRLDRSEHAALRWLLVALWAPIGLPLALLRTAVAAIISIVAPTSIKGRLVLLACGVILPKRTLEVPESGAVVMCNHSSSFDPWAIRGALHGSVPPATVVWHKVPGLFRMMVRPFVPVFPKGKNGDFAEQLQGHLASRSIVLFPEGALTDGHAGLLRFQKAPFSLDATYLFAAVRYRRALPFFAPSGLRANLFAEILFDLAQPYIVLEVTPVEVSLPADATPQERAQLAQRAIADALGVAATEHDRSDRHALMVRLGHLSA